MSVFAEPLAQARHVIAYLAEQSAAAEIDGTAPQDEGFAALDLIEQRATDMEKALEGLIAWNDRWPSHRVYGSESIKKVAAEMDAVVDQARAALSAREEAQT